MSYYEKVVVPDIEEKRNRRIKGEYNGIPFPYQKYNNYVPCIDKGVYYGLVAPTGSGKSRWARSNFVYNPFEFAMNTGYSVKMLYFALEDSKRRIYNNFVAHYLWKNYGIDVPEKYLMSQVDPLPQKFMSYIKDDVAFFKIFEENVFVIDDKHTPDEIRNACLKFHEKYGADNHLIVIVDNYSNIIEGAGDNTQWDAIRRFSRNIVRQELCNKLNISVLAIMQMDFDTEKHNARNSGATVNPLHIEPNLGSIGDAKVVAKDMFIIWAMFNPWKYEIEYYPSKKRGWFTGLLRDNFRAVKMLKNNFGEAAPRLGLRFYGTREVFEELPSPDEPDKLEAIYREVADLERLKLQRKGGNLFD